MLCRLQTKNYHCFGFEHVVFTSVLTAEANINYRKAENWAFKPTKLTKPVDVFFLCPSVYRGKKGSYNMSLEDAALKKICRCH